MISVPRIWWRQDLGRLWVARGIGVPVVSGCLVVMGGAVRRHKSQTNRRKTAETADTTQNPMTTPKYGYREGASGFSDACSSHAFGRVKGVLASHVQHDIEHGSPSAGQRSVVVGFLTGSQLLYCHAAVVQRGRTIRRTSTFHMPLERGEGVLTDGRVPSRVPFQTATFWSLLLRHFVSHHLSTEYCITDRVFACFAKAVCGAVCGV